MKKLLVLKGLTAIAAIILLTSCSKLPQEEMDAANNAIEMAEASGAAIYLPDSYLAVQDSMKTAVEQLEVQKSKLFKKYGPVKDKMIRIADQARQVQLQTEAKKEELKNEIMNTVAQIKQLIESNHRLILEAPKGKEGTTALVSIKSEVDALQVSVDEVSGMLAGEEYLVTLGKARMIRQKAQSINTELQEVITKYKENVKRRKA